MKKQYNKPSAAFTEFKLNEDVLAMSEDTDGINNFRFDIFGFGQKLDDGSGLGL